LVAVQQAQQKTKQQPKGKILEKVFPGIKLVFLKISSAWWWSEKT
jgi:hypothetical protein